MTRDAVSSVLVVGKEAGASAQATHRLLEMGVAVFHESAAEQVARRVERERFDAIFICSSSSTLDVERRLAEAHSAVPIFVLGEDAASDDALRFLATVRPEVARADAESGDATDPFVGNSAPMKRLLETIHRVAQSDATALIAGETGTGKELVARRIHEKSARSRGPFVALNCAAVSEGLVESELFGHVRGAFTDARLTRRGLLVAATGGTMFLDEIGELPLGVQSKLLRALQERTVRPVGADTEIAFDARVIAATNRDLEGEIAAGRFRQDLYYRVNVISVGVPPLRERGRDALLLAEHFLKEAAARSQKPVTAISDLAAARLLSYPWPGNVRELENCIEQAVAFAPGSSIQEEDLPLRIRQYSASTPPPDSPRRRSTLEELEREYIEEVLRSVQGNKSEAARILGIDRKTLYRRLEAYRVSESRPGSGTFRLDDSSVRKR